MRVLSPTIAILLLAFGLTACAVGGRPGYSSSYGWGYGPSSPHYYGASPFAYRHPYRDRYDHDWYVAERDPLSRKQVLKRLDRRGYSDFGDFERRRGAYFVEARDPKGRSVVLKIDRRTGRVLDTARQ